MTLNELPPVNLLIDQLPLFMDEHIYPHEDLHQEQLNSLEDRFTTVPLMEELKARAKAQGLWNLWIPKKSWWLVE